MNNYSKEIYNRTLKGMAEVLTAAVVASVMATGCGNTKTDQASGTGDAAAQASSDSSSESVSSVSASKDVKSAKGEIAITVTDGNIDISGQNSDSVKLSGSTITITKAGTYRLSGTLTEGQILVEAGDKDDVQLVLDGFSISNSETAPIYVKTSGNFFLEIEAGTDNTVEDKREAVSSTDSTVAEEIPDAAIYSKSDLYIIGTGTLNVNGGYADGIHGKDLLMVSEAVTLNINAAEHGINGKDSLEIQAGTFNITSGEDALHSKGDVIISDGTVNISAEDDGIHAETALIINGGKVNVAESYEGLEGLSVTINGGEVSVTASDDGINSAGGSDTSDDIFAVTDGAAITINGGTVYITAAGDGIDSNGNVVITGGDIYVDGPEMDGNASLDYNGTATITGGSFALTGSSGMFQSFSEDSTQAQIIVYYSEKQAAGTEITVTDSEGNVIYENADSTKAFTAFLLSDAKLKDGETYTVKTGDQEETVTIDGLTGTIGERSANMMGGRMGGPGQGGPRGQGGPGGQGGNAPSDMGGTLPEMNGAAGQMGNPPEGAPEMPAETR
ncbi:carbohydrate-binding domain-containing protein [Oribacterium sp. P6A1]|uniref:carbohydrate-binding domain-containing protein n=1 Tax=Oribacterium sp. P6A1 TaxID=1410612 RepID=UPI0006920959|nr:carbohydrate-binding domain-containing protein [Oribacterium sp. P6A1]